MLETLSYVLLIAIPTAVIAWFVVSLIRFLRTPKEDTLKRRSGQTMLLISGFILGSLILAVVSVISFFYMAIRYM